MNDLEPKNDDAAKAPDPPRSERIPRGANPPKVTLQGAVAIIRDFYEKAGGEGSEDVLSVIMDNSVSSSTFRAKVGNLKNFELIEDVEGKVKLSQCGNSIVAPKENSERMVALKKAFLSMDKFKIVYEKFAGRMLPQDEYLINSFAELVPRPLAQEWMEIFKESAYFAGLLIERGDNKYQVRSDIGEDATATEPKEEMLREKEVPVAPPDTGIDQKHTVENAIRRIELVESKKSIWIGTDANMFEIRSGRDMNLVLALIKLLDKYEADEPLVED